MPILTSQERLGTVLGDTYRLERVLGSGGFGTVFAAVHEWTGRPIAVKLLDSSLAEREGFVDRFLREARSAARLAHPNVVDVLDMGRAADGSVYLALELLEGEDLGTALDRTGPLGLAKTLTYLLPVMDALAEAHKLGIVHRDLKPANVFLATDAYGVVVPKLLDFGIAKDVRDAALRTRTGEVWGTPSYMSPEQALGERDTGPASDVWSMGVVLFECLSGKRPFTAESPTGVLAKVLTTVPPSVGSVVPSLSPKVVAVIDRALAREPDQRYSSMRTFLVAIVGAAGAAVPSEMRDWVREHVDGASGDSWEPATRVDSEKTRESELPTGRRLAAGASTVDEELSASAQLASASAGRRRKALLGVGAVLAVAAAALGAMLVIVVTPESDPPAAIAPDAPPTARGVDREVASIRAGTPGPPSVVASPRDVPTVIPSSTPEVAPPAEPVVEATGDAEPTSAAVPVADPEPDPPVEPTEVRREPTGRGRRVRPPVLQVVRPTPLVGGRSGGSRPNPRPCGPAVGANGSVILGRSTPCPQ